MFKFRLAALITAALCLLSGCSFSGFGEPISSTAPDDYGLLSPDPSETRTVGELYGSYFTMRYSYNSALPPMPYIIVPQSYSDIENYYNSTADSYFYGKRFTLALYSFDDAFLAENDVLILAIDEPSSYVSHTAAPIEITKDEVKISLTRHIQENAPMKSTQYHLIFTAPKGSFAGADSKQLNLSIDEIVDAENNTAFDAEVYRMYRPEYWPYCYRADALTDDAGVTVDTIDGYDDLVAFLETYREYYDLDSSFSEYVGTLYNWQICDRYILIATMVPCSEDFEPQVSDLFVNNLQIYMTIDTGGNTDETASKTRSLILTAIERSDLEGVALDTVFLSIE